MLIPLFPGSRTGAGRKSGAGQQIMAETIPREIRAHGARCRSELVDNILPFWLKHAPDREKGGYFNCLDSEGIPFSSEKGMWSTARATWMFSRAANDIEREPAWLDFARRGCRFMLRHGFDDDGRMYFLVTRDGRPVYRRRYLYTECFASIALSEYGRASCDGEALRRAREIFTRVLHLAENPGASLCPKFLAGRELKTLSLPMILLSTAQVLRRNMPDPLYDEVIGRCASEMLDHFLDHGKRALLENVGPGGERRFDIPAGRLVNPGHALECAWFLLEETRRRPNPEIASAALRVIDYALQAGWDEKFGGILYFVDLEGRPPEQYEHDMKLWWVHLEALYATLLAWRVSGRKKYLDWFNRVNTYCFGYFPDPAHGEWFGYLHRDGTLSNPLKGSHWKAPFHLPRALLNCHLLVDEISVREGLSAAPGKFSWCGPEPEKT